MTILLARFLLEFGVPECLRGLGRDTRIGERERLEKRRGREREREREVGEGESCIGEPSKGERQFRSA